ncbi:LuxR family transcriptional regulator [Sphingomonas sp. QA11]|uniref:helix-turn-helix transcriptional regulator n=1 Tax=Sphingomonas sp. QA11 TaxID=2950605 RepID=UPI002349437E|nr:LuxR family transcriptional regulator [Sphingomonas sp. QA11]WCM28017.1 LuxR family transcriptional regulator [Sphingomonas sp. QA11]
MFADGALQHQVSHALHAAPMAAWGGEIPSVAWTLAGSGLETCHSPEDLNSKLDHCARAHGFSGGRYIHLGHRVQSRGLVERPPLRFVSSLGVSDDPWRAGDPAAPKIFVSFHPFEWSSRDDLELPDRQRAWLSVERSRGVEAGIAIPVQDYLSGPAYLSLLGGTEVKAAAIARAEARHLTFLAIAFHCRAKALLPARDDPASILTDREVNCLRYAASGASLSQTAASLGIATRTVELYFARAVRKLGALNRIHAVALALSAGVIQI